MLPYGGEEARGCVTKQGNDNDGNLMGRANDNPILDSRQYVVKLDDSTKDELAKSASAQSMHAQCKPNVNK